MSICDLLCTLQDAHGLVTPSTGIGPEIFAYVGSDGGNWTDGPPPSVSDQAFYDQHGFYVYDG